MSLEVVVVAEWFDLVEVEIARLDQFDFVIVDVKEVDGGGSAAAVVVVVVVVVIDDGGVDGWQRQRRQRHSLGRRNRERHRWRGLKSGAEPASACGTLDRGFTEQQLIVTANRNMQGVEIGEVGEV